MNGGGSNPTGGWRSVWDLRDAPGQLWIADDESVAGVQNSMLAIVREVVGLFLAAIR